VASQNFTGRTALLVLLLVVVGVGLFNGVRRVDLDTDILAAMPNEVPSVGGLKIFRERFVDRGEAVLLISDKTITEDQNGESSGISDDRMASLELAVEAAVDGADLRFRNPWEEGIDDFAFVLAQLWLHSASEDFEAFAKPLADGQATAIALESLETISESFDQAEIFRASYDPIGFLNHPAIAALTSGGSEQGTLMSRDGTARLCFVTGGEALPSYREKAMWVQNLRDAIEGWRSELVASGEVPPEIRITGDPAYASEIGSGMENDMRNTVILTSSFIALLFLLVLRSPRQLVGAGICLVLTLFVVVGIWGYAVGHLTIVSVGFAAILIGLVIDYAAVLGREASCAMAEDGIATTPKSVRRAVGPGILLAAVTTSAVFGMLAISTLPGVSQLGWLVAIGLIVGAAIVLLIYPRIAVHKPGTGFLSRLPQLPQPKISPRVAVVLSLVLFVVVVATTFLRGFSGIDFDFGHLRPRDSEAYDTFEQIRKDFDGWGDEHVELLIKGKSRADVEVTIESLRQDIANKLGEGAANRLTASSGFWPDPAAAKANQELGKEIGDPAAIARILAGIEEVGFAEEATGLARAVLGSMTQIVSDSPERTLERLAGCELFSRTYSPEPDGGGLLRGSFVVENAMDEATATKVNNIAAGHPNVTATGWALMGETLRPLVREDAARLAPLLALLLVVALSIAFRNWRDVVLTLGLMTVVLLGVNVVGSLIGIRWNFLNIFAIPLAVGIGIDYAIHLIFALRRSKGNLAYTWNSVGLALAFCGGSTAIGFGSLSMASSEALATLGSLCALAVLMTMVLAIGLLPGVWKALHGSD